MKDENNNSVWIAVRRCLEIDIINGVYESGKKVPSINEVSAKFNISYTTAKKVLQRLEEDGVLLGKRGKGYFVRPFMGEQLKENMMMELEEEVKKTVQVASQILEADTFREIVEKQIMLHYSTQEDKEKDI